MRSSNRFEKLKDHRRSGKRGWIIGNPRYCRARLDRLLEGERVKDWVSPRKAITMGSN